MASLMPFGGVVRAARGTSRLLRGRQSTSWLRGKRARSSGSLLFWTFVLCVCSAGLVLWTWAVREGAPAAQVLSSEPFALAFAMLVMTSELRPLKWLRKAEGGEVTASWSFAAALLLIAPPQAAILTAALASALADAVHKKASVRVMFNAAQTSLSLAAGAVILQLTHSETLLTDPALLAPSYLLVIATAGVTILLANSSMTCIVLALHQRMPVWGMIRRNLTRNLSTDGMLLALAPIFVVVSQRSPVLVPLLLLTSYAVHRSARLALERQHEATHDALTGLPNRRHFDEQVAGAVAAATRRRHELAVMMIDLDGFKEINDRLGHQTGDQLLVAVGIRLRAVARNQDVVARLGGDEFAVLSTGVVERENILDMAMRLREAMTQPFDLDGVTVTVGGSFGVAFFPEHGTDPTTLAEHADAAMYQAKRTRQGVISYGSLPGHEQQANRQSLMRDLEEGIERNQLELHYQPVQDLHSGRIVGAEALVRWQHPRLGLIQPGEFIPLAEQTELIGPLSRWVLDHAIQDAATWDAAGHELAVAVNISARNVEDLRFPDTVAHLLERRRLPGAKLELEITENAISGDIARVRQVLERLGELGAAISIDDFGTGYSSLSHLLDLPTDTIKVDRSFVSGMADQREAELIVRSVIGLAQGLGLCTVAEGVEDAHAVHTLANLGCERLQGFFIARPMPFASLLRWLATRTATPYLVGVR